MGSQAVRIYGAGDAAGLPLGSDPTKPLYSTNGTYRRAAAVSSTAGDALLVSGVTTAGTITVTLIGGGSLTVEVPLGTSILPYAATAAALGTAVGGSFQSLFFV